MGLDMKFGVNTSTITPTDSGKTKADRAVKGLISKGTGHKDYAKVVGEALGLAGKYKQIEEVSNANQAKADWIKFSTSEQYLSARKEDRASLLESQYKYIADKPTSYTDSFLGYSAGEYSTQFENRLQSEADNYLNAAPAGHEAWAARPENTDKDPSEFVAEYNKLNSRMGLVNINRALSISTIRRATDIIKLAEPSRKGLQAAEEEAEEVMHPFQSPMFLQTKEKKGKEAYTLEKNKLKGAIQAKEREIKAKALTKVELTKDSKNPQVLNQYLDMPDGDTFFDAYGDKAEQKQNDYRNTYGIYEEARQKSYVFNPAETTNWGQENKITKQAYQEALDYSIISYMNNGDMVGAGEMIKNQGSVDSKRLANTRQAIKSSMNTDDIGSTYGQLMKLMVTDSSAFNALFPDPKERGKYLALSPMSLKENLSLQDTWKYINGTPSITPDMQTRTEKTELNNMVHNHKIPVGLRKEIEVMYYTMSSYGQEHSDIIDSINTYLKTDPYKLDLSLYSSNQQDVMMDALDTMKINPDDMVFEDVHTGTIYGQSVDGFKTRMIDKKGLDAYTNRVSTILEYNRKHWAKAGFENTMDTTSTIVGKATDYGKIYGEDVGKYLLNTADALDYLFRTELDRDGNIVEREPWKPKYELESFKGDKNIVKSLENLIGVVGERYKLDTEESAKKAQEIILATIKQFPDIDPIEASIKIFTNQEFPYTSEEFKGTERLEQEAVNTKLKKSKDTLAFQLTNDVTPTTFEELDSIGERGEDGMLLDAIYTTDEQGNELPEGIIRKLGKYYKMNY